MMNEKNLEAMNKRLARMQRAVGSNELSGRSVSSEEGRLIISQTLSSVLADDFNVSEAREQLLSRIKKAAAPGR